MRYDAATERIVIIAHGFATEQKSRQAGQRFVELLGVRHVDLVVDLDAMTGYTTEARRAWQECFYPVRAQLRRMLIVGRDIPVMIRMGATVVAAFSGIPVRYYPTLESLDAARPEERPRTGR